MPDFHERLEKAIERGQKANDQLARARAEQAMGEEELRRLHTQYRLQLSEHIENCLKQLPQHFPGFRYEVLSGDKGWGAALARDDFTIVDGRRASHYSRLELSVRPFSASHVLELTAKGTIRDKEVFNRSQYHVLSSVDIASFRELVDRWILEYAELYAAKT